MIKIITCFWNVEDYIENCINSIKLQKFKEFKVFLIDDMSTDKTVEKINKLIDGDDRFILIKNEEKKFKLRNMDELIRNKDIFNDEDIIVELDGDDWLYDDMVLSFINEKYKNNPNLWITNGSWVWSTGGVGFSNKVNPDTVRYDPFTFSHLRTWKCHLWRKINKESLQYDDGTYFKSGADVAYTFPMVEMSGNEHYEYIPNILLVYNGENPRNDHKPGSASGSHYEQIICCNIIRNMKKYERI
jgi:glycosyltransferase involved in cell wall biosynthesis